MLCRTRAKHSHQVSKVGGVPHTIIRNGKSQWLGFIFTCQELKRRDGREEPRFPRSETWNATVWWDGTGPGNLIQTWLFHLGQRFRFAVTWFYRWFLPACHAPFFLTSHRLASRTEELQDAISDRIRRFSVHSRASGAATYQVLRNSPLSSPRLLCVLIDSCRHNDGSDSTVEWILF